MGGDSSRIHMTQSRKMTTGGGEGVQDWAMRVRSRTKDVLKGHTETHSHVF